MTMTTERNLRERLLQQDNFDSRTAAGLRDKILTIDQRRVRRMKWAAGICWIVFLAVLFLAASGDYFRDRDIPLLGITAERLAYYFPEVAWLLKWGALIIAQALLMVAVLLTFSLHARSRTLTVHQIQASLAGIEEQLRKMVEKKEST